MAPRVAIHAPRTPDGQVVLRLSGDLDITCADAVRTALLAAVRAEPAVVVELSELAFIDVAGMRALRDAHDAARSRGCSLLLAAPRPCVRRLAALMDLGDLPFCESAPALQGGAASPRPGRLAGLLR